jgi:phosphoribosylformimino-5-aminoimidazole carboxamide ribotide isomerase
VRYSLFEKSCGNFTSAHPIPIVHGVCASQIAALTPRDDHASQEIYSPSPVDRARLLRKENAKTLHLEFWDSDPWSIESLQVIAQMRHAVDIPFELSLASLPENMEDLDVLLRTGIYRVFLPLDTPIDKIFQCATQCTNRAIVATINLNFDLNLLPILKDHGVSRLGVDISPVDSLESAHIDWPSLQALHDAAKTYGIRLTVLHGVRGYPDLKALQDIGSGLDSLVLCRALNENRFPCQLIWREVEAEAALEADPLTNLWTNPLEGRPHL